MTNALESLKSPLFALPTRERAELAHFLIETLENECHIDVDAAWDWEINRCVDEIREGRVIGKPAEQVFAELRERTL